MRSLRKPILLLLAVALVVSVTVYATVSFMTDTEEITNTFSVGKVDISLDEAKVDPETGRPTGENDRTYKENTYHLVPGRSYTKDPTVSVAQGSESCYVRMVVSVNKASELTNLFGGFLNFVNYYDPAGAEGGYGSTFWKLHGSRVSDSDTDTVIYEFRYYMPVWNPGRLEPLFTSFAIPGNFSGSQLAAIADLKIVVQAHAIQIEGFGHSETGVTNAWAAFDGQVSDPYVIKPNIIISSVGNIDPENPNSEGANP